MSKIIIYGLYNPIDLSCFYIGKTKNGLRERLYQHLKDKTANKHKYVIINRIIREGLKPLIYELVSVEDKHIDIINKNLWELYEIEVIRYMRDELKEPLTNVSIGGDDCTKIPNRKKVNQYDITGKFIKQYESISEAGRDVKSELISKATKGKINTTAGYQWAIEGEEEHIKDLTTIKRKHKQHKHSIEYINNKNNRDKQNQIIKYKKEQERLEYRSVEAVEERKRIRKEKFNEYIKEYRNRESTIELRKEQRKRYRQLESTKELRKEQKIRQRAKQKLNKGMAGTH